MNDVDTTYSCCWFCGCRILKRAWSQKWAHDNGPDGTDWYCHRDECGRQSLELALPVKSGLMSVRDEKLAK